MIALPLKKMYFKDVVHRNMNNNMKNDGLITNNCINNNLIKCEQ